MRIFLLILSSLLVFSCSNKVNFNQNDESISDDDTVVEHDKITDIRIEENTANVLSCRLMFKTPEDSSARIRYFSSNHSGYELTGEKTKDHYFFLWGMRAETDYTIEIYLDDREEPVETVDFRSGELPEFMPFKKLDVKSDDVSEGFTLFTYYFIPQEESRPVIIMVDTDGQIIWYYQHQMPGFSLIGDVQYLEKTETILIGIEKGPNMIDIPAEEAVEIDLEGNVLWNSRQIANVYADKDSWHHIYELLEDDTIAILRREVIDNVICDVIVNLDRDYRELWKWRYRDHFEMPETDSSEEFNWTHSNSVSMFRDNKVVYLNSRDQSQFYKIDMETGDILWTFGKNGDFTMLGDHPDPWFEFAHDPELFSYDDTEILFYDNGTPQRGFSRVIKYRIDYENMTAEVIFEFDGSKDGKMWYTEYWGDADELENGNILITIGEFEQGDPSKLVEVSPQGKIVWKLVFPENNGLSVSLYNAQKFVPGLKSL